MEPKNCKSHYLFFKEMLVSFDKFWEVKITVSEIFSGKFQRLWYDKALILVLKPKNKQFKFVCFFLIV